MKPIQMVREQCDCYNAGVCLGITVDDNLKPRRFRAEGQPCLLAGAKLQRCEHFESSILPYKPDAKDSRRAALLQAEWSEGSHAYRIATGYMADTIRICPQCRVAKISGGRKLCDLCKAKNRRETKSKSDSARNAESNSHSSSFSAID